MTEENKLSVFTVNCHLLTFVLKLIYDQLCRIFAQNGTRVAVVPQQLIDTLQDVTGFDEASFKQVHETGAQVTSIRINPAKWNLENAINYPPFSIAQKVPWSQYGFYLAQRPSFTFDPLFHAGCYYVQEASSLFLEQALQQTTDLSQPLKVLDLCAAPGGKTTHLQSLLSSNSLLAGR